MKHLTAQEAAKISANGKKTKDEIANAIRVMSENGHNYAFFKADDVYMVEQQKEYWETLGYSVKLDDHLQITW